MKRVIRLLAGLVLAINAAACSYVKGYFPDKQKDYQFTTEIPPLQIPPDLQDNAIEDGPLVVEPAYRPDNSRNIDGVADIRSTDESPAKFIPVELVDYDGGATRLRIEKPIAIAWRHVGKALSHHSIEIISRNEEKYQYVVQYDSNASRVDDGALWDELVFLFGDDPAQEKEFHIRMAAKNARMTEVIILDKNDQPRSQGKAMDLLKLLQTTINKDLADEAKSR